MSGKSNLSTAYLPIYFTIQTAKSTISWIADKYTNILSHGNPSWDLKTFPIITKREYVNTELELLCKKRKIHKLLFVSTKQEIHTKGQKHIPYKQSHSGMDFCFDKFPPTKHPHQITISLQPKKNNKKVDLFDVFFSHSRFVGQNVFLHERKLLQQWKNHSVT